MQMQLCTQVDADRTGQSPTCITTLANLPHARHSDNNHLHTTKITLQRYRGAGNSIDLSLRCWGLLACDGSKHCLCHKASADLHQKKNKYVVTRCADMYAVVLVVMRTSSLTALLAGFHAASARSGSLIPRLHDQAGSTS